MSSNFRGFSRSFFSISWPIWALALLAVVAASCAGSQEAAELVEPEPAAPTAPDTDFVGAPEALPFADQPLTLRISVPDLPVALPQDLVETNTVQVLIADLLTDGLTRRNPADGSIEPAIAESWSSSDDDLRWTFELGDATFSDGSPVVASDVVASLTALAERGITSVSGPNLWPVVGWTQAGEAAAANPDAVVDVPGIQAIGDDQVEFTLSQPFTPLPEILSGVTFGVLPADVGDTTSVGSAVDFELTEQWADGFSFVGEQVNGEVSTIEVLLDPDFTMLRAGETDIGVGVEDAESLNGLDTVEVERAGNVYLAMNASVEPLNDPLIRQAIMRSVDVDMLRELRFPEAAPMVSLIPEQLASGRVDACNDNCDLDLEQARTLVQASPRRDVAITVDFIAGDVDEQIAFSIVESLGNVGLSATAVSHSAEEYAEAAAAGELGIFQFGSVTTTLAAEASIGLAFHTDGSDNITATSIDRVDELIDRARETHDAQLRADLYADADRVLLAEAVVVPVAEFQHSIALGNRVESAGLEPDGSLDLAQIELAQAEAPILQGE